MIIEFIKENFFYLHPGYTTFNTIIFGIVLGLIVIIIIEMFQRLKKDPGELLPFLIPFILFGSSTRALVDNHVYPKTYLLVTPGLYIFVGLLTIAVLLISIFLEKKYNKNYCKTIALFGILFCIPNIILYVLHGISLTTLSIELFLWIIISLPFILLKNKFKVLNNNINLSVLSAHIFDATSTFVAIEFFGYTEQHVLPTLLINSTQTALVMYPLKIIIILGVLYIIDNYLENKTTQNMLKLAIFILGLAPGIRNVLTLALMYS